MFAESKTAYRPQAAAATDRIVGKPDIHTAAEYGDVALVKDHILADPACVNAKDQWYNPSVFPFALL